MKITGAEGESTEDIQKVFNEEFESKLNAVQENIEKVKDKTFR